LVSKLPPLRGFSRFRSVSPIMFRRYAGIIDTAEQEAALTPREAFLERDRSNVAQFTK